MRRFAMILFTVFISMTVSVSIVTAKSVVQDLRLDSLIPVPAQSTQPMSQLTQNVPVPVWKNEQNRLKMATDRSLVLAGIPTFHTVTVTLKYEADERSTLSVTIPEGAEVTDAGGGRIDGEKLHWQVGATQTEKGEVSYTIAFNEKGKQTDTVSKSIIHRSTLLSSTQNVEGSAEASTTVIYPGAETEERPPYIFGFPDRTFRPDNSLTRAQGIAIVVRLAFPDGAYKIEEGDQLFPDVKVVKNNSRASHWAAKEIAKGVKEGLISGYPDGTFRPDNPMTRGEYMLMLARALSKNPMSHAHLPYPDVKGEQLQAAVGLLQKLNVLQGFPDGTLKPDLKITRKEVVVMTNKVVLRFPLDRNGKATFLDVQPKHWYYGDVEAASTSQKYMRIPSTANPLEGIGKLLGK